MLILFIATGCIHQRVFYNSYDDCWYVQTTIGDKYVKDQWYTNYERTGEILKQEKEYAKKYKEMVK